MTSERVRKSHGVAFFMPKGESFGQLAQIVALKSHHESGVWSEFSLKVSWLNEKKRAKTSSIFHCSKDLDDFIMYL